MRCKLLLLVLLIMIFLSEGFAQVKAPDFGNPVYVATVYVSEAEQSVDKIFSRFNNVDINIFKKKEEIHDLKHEIEEVRSDLSKSKALLNNQSESYSRQVKALEMSIKKLSSIEILLVTNEKYLLEKSSSTIKAMEMSRFYKLIFHVNALVDYIVLLNEYNQKLVSTNDLFVEAQKAVKNSEDFFYRIYDRSLSVNKDQVLIEIIQQKMLEGHLALLKAQVAKGKDQRGVSLESRKYVLETKQTLSTVQNLLFSLEYEWRKDSLSQEISSSFVNSQIWLEWANGALSLGEADMHKNISSLPYSEDVTPDAIDEEENGVTQDHVIKALNSLVETQELLMKTIDMVPQAHAERTQNIALQVHSQQMLLQSIEEDFELQESVNKSQAMLNETDEYISSTRKIAEKYPDSVITYRQYLNYFDHLLIETNQAIEETQKLIKGECVDVEVFSFCYQKNEKISNDQRKQLRKLADDMMSNIASNIVVEISTSEKNWNKKRLHKWGESIENELNEFGISTSRIFIKLSVEEIDDSVYDCVRIIKQE